MGGSQERYDSVGVMENRRRRAREQPTPRGKEKDTAEGGRAGGRAGERRRYLYSAFHLWIAS